MATDKSVLSLDIVNSMQPDDTFFIISSSKATRIKWSTILNSVNEWDNITDKPFDDYDTVTLGIDVDPNSGTRRLKVNPSITNAVHTHTNKAVLDELSDVEGELYYNDTPIGVSAWDEVTDKPFSTVDENDFEIVDDEISISSTLKTTISNLETDSHTHTNKTVLDKFSEVGGVLEYDGSAVGGGGVTSVNDQTGAVTLTADSVLAVSYNSQSLTTAQQTQVRTNIGLPPIYKAGATTSKGGNTNNTVNDGTCTFVYGSGCRASNIDYAFVFGLSCSTHRNYSVVIGNDCRSSGGDYSVAIGDHVEADHAHEWAIGMYNSSSADTAFAYGDGTSWADRHNLMELKTDGTLLLNGNPVAVLSTLTGYDATKTQTLKNVNGTFTWVDDT